MRKDPEKLCNAIKNYPALGNKEKENLHTWISMVGNFLFTESKFIAGCATGNGFLCFSAIYSALIGIAKNHYIRFSYDEGYKISSETVMFGYFGLLIALSGIAYSVYMGRLVLYPSAVSYTVWQGVLIAFVCTCDVSVAVYGLINVPKKESSLLLFGKKLLNLATAIPAAVMAHVALNACTALPDKSYWDGVFGILAGTALSFMGVFMMLYTRRHKKYYENKNDIA